MKNFKNLLAKPGRESQPWAIWIWNLTLTRTELERQLKSFIEKGFGGIAIRPGRDMKPAYMSEEFLELFESALAIAKENGILIRIADDFSLPWGGVFHSLVRQAKQYRAHHLVLKQVIPVETKSEFEKEVDDDMLILAVRNKEGSVVLRDVKILVPQTGKKAINWKVPAGEWKICIFEKEYIHDNAGSFVPNIFNPRVAQLYIEEVLERLKSRFTKFVPGTFEGFINEMTAFRPADNAIPWDDDLAAKYKGKYKRDLVTLLPSLFFGTDVPSGRTKCQIYDFINESMFERFAAPLESWSKKYRLSQWVLIPERGIFKTANMLIDGALPSESLSCVGLQNQDGTEENLPLLKLNMDANVNEYRRETVTVIGRNRQSSAGTIQSFKSEVDLNVLNGVSKVIIDGFFFNIDQRSYIKTPYNPAWYAPGWEHMKCFCDYTSRLLEISRDLHYTNQVAVFSPTAAIQSEYRPDNAESSRRGILQIHKTIGEINRLDLDYSMLSEEQLLHCQVRTTGEFGTADRIRKGSHQALILPYAPFVSRSLLVFLEKLVSKHGLVVFIDEAPKGTFEDGVNASVTGRIEKLVSSKRNSAKVVPVGGLDQALSSLKNFFTVKVQGKTCPDIYCSHGSGEGYEVYTIHNISERNDYQATIELPMEKYFTFVDCENGELIEIDNVERTGDRCMINVGIGTKRTFVIIASAVKLAGATHAKVFRNGISPFHIPQRNYRIVLKDQWTFEPLSLNVLPLANWSVRIGLSRESGGFSHFYETHFQAKVLPSQCYFIMNGLSNGSLPGDTGVEASINGTRIDRPGQPVQQAVDIVGTSQPVQVPAVTAVQPLAADPKSVAVIDESLRRLFGKQTGSYPVNELLIRGFNRVSLRTTGAAGDPQPILYPPLVIGNFSVTKGSNGWAIDKPSSIIGHDSWTRYGYPYLSGMGIYRQSFEIPNEYKRIILRISQASGSVEIKLNEKNLGLYHWHPIELDITSICEPKRNELSIGVFNTIDNVVRLNGRPSGLTGEVYLDVY